MNKNPISLKDIKTQILNAKSNIELTFALETLGMLTHSSLEEFSASSQILLCYLKHDAPIVQEGALLGLGGLVYKTDEIEGRLPMLTTMHTEFCVWKVNNTSSSLTSLIFEVEKDLDAAIHACSPGMVN
jgi:hypothetical protein